MRANKMSTGTIKGRDRPNNVWSRPIPLHSHGVTKTSATEKSVQKVISLLPFKAEIFNYHLNLLRNMSGAKPGLRLHR